MLSPPAFAEDVRFGTWGGAKSDEGAEVSTSELVELLKTGATVLDVRSAKECAIAHIPGSVCMPGVLRSDGSFGAISIRLSTPIPIGQRRLCFTVTGRYCGKSKRTAKPLIEKGYANVRRYQLGLPVWRALGNTVQTDLRASLTLEGRPHGGVVDARSPETFKADTLPGSVNVRKGEAKAANEDGRLSHTDKGTRIVVFGTNAEEARDVAVEVAQNAFWNSSYFGGSYEDIKSARLW